MVKYINGNIYKCIQQTTTVPTDTTYWKLVTSKGDKGDTGDKGNTGNKGETGTEGQGYLYAYCFSNSLTPPPKPSTGGVIPNGWMSSPEFNGYRYIYVSQCIKTNGSWGNWSDPSLYAMKPEPGDPGPAAVYRGEFSNNDIYYNNAARRDVVLYNSKYYIYAGNDASSGNWNSSNWQEFGSQFSSVATDLLLAINANVGGFIFKNGRLESVNGKTYLDGESGVIVIESGIFKGSIATPFVWNTYYGGKQKMLRHILPLIPEHKIYSEAFFGGGAVFRGHARAAVKVQRKEDFTPGNGEDPYTGLQSANASSHLGSVNVSSV
jgi:hypothetical protein